MTTSRNVVAAGLLGFAALALVLAGDAFAQRKPLSQPADAVRLRQADKEKQPAARLDVVWYGNSACSNKGCHGGDPPKTWFKNADTGKQFELISRCVEADHFEKYDKHNDAYKVLKGKLGKQMAKVLKYDVTKAPECLACHGVSITDPAVRKASAAVGFDVEEGVSCAVCHGPHREWVANHGIMVSAGKFRGLSREKKEHEYGMRNLHDPVRRTELCVSCHVGNLAEKKFVTHEMYAAGHPPLPGFEVATFSNPQTRHWQYMKEKSPALQKELGLREGEQEETLLVLIGAAVTFRETMILLRDQAAEAAGSSDEARQIIDLSNFDCWSCHHDLKKQSWRQNKEWIGKRKPGRPPMRDWSAELVRVAVKYLAAKDKSVEGKGVAKQLDRGIEELHAAFDARNGGDPARIEKAAASLAKLTDTLAADLYKAYPTAADARSLPGDIASAFDKKLLGYDSARQVSWGAEAIFNEAHGKGGPTAARDGLSKLEKALRLRLPTGRKATIADHLDESMDAVERHDPFEFRKMLNAFGKGFKSKE